MATHGAHTIFVVALVVAPVVFMTACHNTVEPFSPTTRHYAIYGFLDADADTQYVRVEATRPNPDLEDRTAVDVPTVRLIHAATNQSVIWRDSTLTLEDGARALLFWAPFRPEPGELYRLEVERDDGAVSSATTLVPDLEQADVQIPSRTFAGTFEQALVFSDISRRPEGITLNYQIAYSGNDDPFPITLDYDVFGAPIDEGWQIRVRLTRDRERIDSRLSIASTRVLQLHGVSMTLRLLSSDWPLVESGQRVVNVEDGFGFYGSASTHEVSWELDSLVALQLNFVDVQNGGNPDE